MMSARACVIWSGARGSLMQPAKRSAMRSRCSTSRSIRTPPSDDNKPPSNVATTDLPETGDRPGNGSVELIMADVVSQKWCGFESIRRLLKELETETDRFMERGAERNAPTRCRDHG